MAIKYKLIIVYFVFWALTTPGNAQSAEIEGVYFNDTFEKGGVQLSAQGTGLYRYMGMLKVFVGAIYYAEGTSADDILNKTAKRLEVEYFYSMDGKDFGMITNEIMSRNVDPQTMERIRSEVGFHNSLYQDVRPGDRYALTYIPGKGTELALNGSLLGVIEGDEFASALFAIWLGEKPMNKSFKEQLLGLR